MTCVIGDKFFFSFRQILYDWLKVNLKYQYIRIKYTILIYTKEISFNIDIQK